MNALIMTSRGIAVIEVDKPAPPRLEFCNPPSLLESIVAGGMPGEKMGHLLRGPRQVMWARTGASSKRLAKFPRTGEWKE